MAGPTELEALPEWPAGTVAVFATAGAEPHAIPVSTAVRAGDRHILLALAHRRTSLARLRADPRAALTLLAAGGVAFTAHGRATVVAERLAATEHVAAVALAVERIQQHADQRFVVEASARFRWVDPDAARVDAAIRAELLDLAGRLPCTATS